jgi:hypothetical protein
MITKLAFSFSLLLLSANTFAECGSFTLTEKSQKITFSFEIPQKNQSIKIKISSDKNNVDDAYFCMKSQESFKCVGDDDGGSFTIKPSSKHITISRIDSGNPDNYRFSISQKDQSEYQITKCNFN